MIPFQNLGLNVVPLIHKMEEDGSRARHAQADQRYSCTIDMFMELETCFLDTIHHGVSVGLLCGVVIFGMVVIFTYIHSDGHRKGKEHKITGYRLPMLSAASLSPSFDRHSLHISLAI